MAGGIAAGVVLVLGGNSSAAPTKKQYFARVAAICRLYGSKLDRIAPPADIAAPGEIVTAVGKALPILRAQTRAMRALRAPTALRGRVARWLALNDRVVARLDDALRAGRLRDIGAMGTAFIRYREAGLAARRLGAQIGFPRPPC